MQKLWYFPTYQHFYDNNSSVENELSCFRLVLLKENKKPLSALEDSSCIFLSAQVQKFFLDAQLSDEQLLSKPHTQELFSVASCNLVSPINDNSLWKLCTHYMKTFNNIYPHLSMGKTLTGGAKNLYRDDPLRARNFGVYIRSWRESCSRSSVQPM